MSDKKESFIEMEDPLHPSTPRSSRSSEEPLELNVLNGGEVNVSALGKRSSSTERNLPLRSYSKWSPTEQGATLVWRDLCVYTGGEHGTSPSLYNMKRIINNSNGAVQPGNLMALMGSRWVRNKTISETCSGHGKNLIKLIIFVIM